MAVKQYAYQNDPERQKQKPSKPVAQKTKQITQEPGPLFQRTRLAPGSLTREQVLQLQGAIGNRVVSRLLAQLKPDNNQLPNRTGLPDQLKAGIEALSGLSMDDVRVHFNSSKPAELNALAYTQGTEIHVAPGQERHLPHEAWHVVQQKRGVVRPDFRLSRDTFINHSPYLEQEADLMGRKSVFLVNRNPYIAVTKARTPSIETTNLNNFPQQFKLVLISGGEVIQRKKLKGYYGDFEDLEYRVLAEFKRPGETRGGKYIGAYIKISFHPTENCPKNAKIGFIQIVKMKNDPQNPNSAGTSKLADILGTTKQWAIDRDDDNNPVYGSGKPGKTSKKLKDNPPSIAPGPLRTKEKDEMQPGAAPEEQVESVEFGARHGEITADGSIDAILIDAPRLYVLEFPTWFEQEQLFETTAIVLEGPAKGVRLGAVRWGWKKAKGSDKPVLEPFELAKRSGSTDNFKAAREVWNANAKQEGFVPIP